MHAGVLALTAVALIAWVAANDGGTRPAWGRWGAGIGDLRGPNRTEQLETESNVTCVTVNHLYGGFCLVVFI